MLEETLFPTWFFTYTPTKGSAVSNYTYDQEYDDTRESWINRAKPKGTSDSLGKIAVHVCLLSGFSGAPTSFSSFFKKFSL